MSEAMDDLLRQVMGPLRAHRVCAYAAGEVACACDGRWRSQLAYREHLARQITSELALTEELPEDAGERSRLHRYVTPWEQR